MIHLLHARQVDRYFSGTLPGHRGPALLERLWRCAPCRDRYARQLLFERTLPEGARRRDERLWQTILSSARGVDGGTEDVATSRGRSPRRWSIRLLLLAPIAIAIVALAPRGLRAPTHDEPVARGGLPGTTLRPVLHLYRSVAGKTELVTDRIGRDDGVLVAYSNPSADLRYLMVFGVDQQGAVHWYYPAYERLGEDPGAVPIRTEAMGVELGEEIRHTLPEGAFKVFALFLPQPRRVLEVEALMQTELARHGGRISEVDALPGVAGQQTSIWLEVTP